LADYTAETIRYNIENLLKKRVDGVIITASMMNLKEEDYKRYRVKETCVAFGTVFPSGKFDVISPDNFKGGYIATKHLIDIGCKKIAMLHAPDFEIEKDLKERFQGYVKALEDNGIEVSEELIFVQRVTSEKSYDAQESYKTIREKLRKVEFDGLFCYNDEMAYGAIEAIKEEGLRIPEDVAIVGYDDIEFSRMLSPSLTSVTFDKYTLGYRAFKMLLERLNDSEMEAETELVDVSLAVKRGLKVDSNEWR